MSNTAQSFLSKDAPPTFLRAIQWLLVGLIAMVVGQLTRVNWENHLDLGIVLVFLLSVFVGIYAITLKETSDHRQ